MYTELGRLSSVQDKSCARSVSGSQAYAIRASQQQWPGQCGTSMCRIMSPSTRRTCTARCRNERAQHRAGLLMSLEADRLRFQSTKGAGPTSANISRCIVPDRRGLGFPIITRCLSPVPSTSSGRLSCQARYSAHSWSDQSGGR